MTKPQISRIWIIGVVVMLVGLIVMGISMGLMFTNGGTYQQSITGTGYDFVPRLDSYFWTTIVFMISGGIVAAIGGIAQLVAWIGALINTYQLQDRTWFIVLLAGGLIGLVIGLTQFAVMIAYVIAGPDGMTAEQRQMPPQGPSTPPMPQPTTLAPS